VFLPLRKEETNETCGNMMFVCGSLFTNL
jgi:hypothetical protein